MQNFFIVGAQKAGTTALHKYLGHHPRLSLSARKELHFFDDETIDWSCPDYERLEKGMGRPTDRICGEATPVTMYWPNSLERLRAYDPSAKIIVLLRHPVFRAHSHWRMETKRNAETLPFSDAIRGGRDRLKQAPDSHHRIFSYVERGFYGRQIEHILSLFPRSQVHFARTDQLWLDPESTLRHMEAFLNVGPEIEVKTEYIVAAGTDVPFPLARADHDYLMALYSDDIRKAEACTGLSLAEWFAESYREPMRVL